jgi:hypothetical protein
MTKEVNKFITKLVEDEIIVLEKSLANLERFSNEDSHPEYWRRRANGVKKRISIAKKAIDCLNKGK